MTKPNPVARAIVANLARRYRKEKWMHLKSERRLQMTLTAPQRMHEAWNAYAVSKRILMGLEP